MCLQDWSWYQHLVSEGELCNYNIQIYSFFTLSHLSNESGHINVRPNGNGTNLQSVWWQDINMIHSQSPPSGHARSKPKLFLMLQLVDISYLLFSFAWKPNFFFVATPVPFRDNITMVSVTGLWLWKVSAARPTLAVPVTTENLAGILQRRTPINAFPRPCYS